jgi:drug/metabolite transporter (DMT)-like permease
VLRRRRLRRTIGVVLIVAGGALMWLAPEPAFARWSLVGIVLLVMGLVLEAVGIALEHRDRR